MYSALSYLLVVITRHREIKQRNIIVLQRWIMLKKTADGATPVSVIRWYFSVGGSQEEPGP